MKRAAVCDALAWLEPWRIEEAFLSECHEKTSPICLQAIKTGLALTSFHFHPLLANTKTHLEGYRAGFQEVFESFPRQCACVVFSPSLAAAALVCAAVSMPIFAGVESVMAISVGQPPAAGICAALELCGVENIHAIPAAKLTEFADCLPWHTPVIILGDDVSTEFTRALKQKEVPYYREMSNPKLGILHPGDFNPESFKFCLGVEPSRLEYSADTHYDALYGRWTDRRQSCHSSLFLGPGCEGFWLFPNLAPSIFLDRKYQFSFLENND